MFIYGAWRPRQIARNKSRPRERKTGMARLGIRGPHADLEKWKAIHPMKTLGVQKANETPQTPPIYHPPHPPRSPRLPRDRSFYARQGEPNPRHACVYCDRVTHRSWECENVTSPAERRRILQNKRLCFNCTGAQHSASQCRSRASCVHCKQRHHSSICDRRNWTPNSEQRRSCSNCNSRRGESLPSNRTCQVEWRDL